MTNALKHWTDRVIAQRSRELEAEASRGFHLTKLAFSKWHTKLYVYAEDQSLVESFRDVKEEECIKRYFKRWSMAARKKKVLKERYEDWTRGKRETLLQGCFSNWYDRTRESKLVEEVRCILCGFVTACEAESMSTGTSSHRLSSASAPQELACNLANSNSCK